MLELKNIFDIVKEDIIFDFYVPINIDFENWESKSPHLYWRTGNFLEIGINKTSQTISSITLVTASKIHLVKHKQEISPERKIVFEGLPTFKTDQWKENIYHLDDPRNRNFDVYVYDNNVMILLEPDNKIELKVVNGRIEFGFDRDKILCSIEVTNITKEEKELLEEIIAKRPGS